MGVGHGIRQVIGQLLSPLHAGDQKLAKNQQPDQGVSTIRISSDAFGESAAIEKKYTGEGINVSPPLRWTGVPKETSELALILEDPDAPFPNPVLHWALIHIPAGMTSLPEGFEAGPHPSSMPGAMQLMNFSKKAAFSGPMPPVGHGVHHYHFQLFALDRKLPLDESGSRDDLIKAMRNHVLASGELIGTYERT